MKGYTMRKFLIAAAAVLISTAAFAGPVKAACSIAGAIPDCEAVLSGQKVQHFEDTSKLNDGPHDPVSHEMSIPETGPDLGAIDRANDAAELERLRYARRIAERHLDDRFHETRVMERMI
jgi:hypothetical protein